MRQGTREKNHARCPDGGKFQESPDIEIPENAAKDASGASSVDRCLGRLLDGGPNRIRPDGTSRRSRHGATSICSGTGVGTHQPRPTNPIPATTTSVGRTRCWGTRRNTATDGSSTGQQSTSQACDGSSRPSRHRLHSGSRSERCSATSL